MNRKILAAVALALGARAEATTTAAITCNPCSDITALQQAAGHWGATHASTAGTIVLVHSLNAPLSGFFRIQNNPKMGGYVAVKITLDNMGAAQLDNIIFARANKHERPIDAPQEYTAANSTISIEIEKTLTPNNLTAGINPWHLLVGFPHVEYWGYYDKLWQSPFDNFIGDMITVNYPGGFSEKWEFQGADKPVSQRWTRVPGTLTRYGKPYNPETTPATPYGGYRSAGGSENWGHHNAQTEVQWEIDICSGTSSVTVTAPDGSTVIGYGVVQC